MNHDTFKLIAQTARELRTEAATYTLLDAYASSGCATYPVDSALFMELWPDGQVPGYALTPYLHIHPPTHTVAYAEVEPRTTHTPGPWVVGNRGTILIDETSSYWGRRLECANRGMGMEGWRVAQVEPEAGMGMSEEDAANARLIAAAPDLLAALREIAGGDANHKFGPTVQDLQAWAAAAIAKAEGGAA